MCVCRFCHTVSTLLYYYYYCFPPKIFGNAKFVIDQVNPLNSNPLNGLAVIGDTFTDIMSAPQTMSKMIRRNFELANSEDDLR